MFVSQSKPHLLADAVDSSRCSPDHSVSDVDSAPLATEAGVRSELCQELLRQTGELPWATFEFWVPRTHERADLVVIGREISSFEIKTERDTLRRLPRQVAAYGRLFDRCTAVVAEKHADAARDIVPEWWGLTTIHSNGRVTFTSTRKARTNPSIDAEFLVRLLWREEAYAALLNLGAEIDVRAPRQALWQALLERASLTQLRHVVRGALVQRDPTRARIGTRRFTTPALALEAAH
jgi:hypothetical protein